MSGSFQLTFTATLGAAALAEPVSDWIGRKLPSGFPAGRTVASVLGMTIGCNLAMLPATLSIFGGISLVSPITNLLVVPLLPVILIWAFFSLALAPVPVASVLCAKGLELLLGIIITSAKWLSGLPAAYLGLSYPFIPFWLGAVLILSLTLLLRKKKRLAVRVVCIMLAGLVGLTALQKFIRRDMLEIVPLQTFDSAGVLVMYRGSASAVFLSDDKYLYSETEEYLRSRNISRIDTLVLGGEETGRLSEMEFLNGAVPVSNIALSRTAPAAPYLSSRVSAKCFLLGEGTGFESSLAGLGQLRVRRCFDGIAAEVTSGDSRICITNSETAAAKAKCEILFLGGKNVKIPAQIPAGCVILLTEPDRPPGVIGGEALSGWENRAFVRMDRSGAIQLGR